MLLLTPGDNTILNRTTTAKELEQSNSTHPNLIQGQFFSRTAMVACRNFVSLFSAVAAQSHMRFELNRQLLPRSAESHEDVVSVSIIKAGKPGSKE